MTAPVHSWAFHRRLYNWTLSLAGHRYAAAALFVVSFAESIFFPIPTVVLQVPMSLRRPEKVWTFAMLATVASVLGGIVGYEVGTWFSHLVQHLFSQAALDHMSHYTGSLPLLIGGALAVHPYKLFTIAAGIFHEQVSLPNFVLASIIGRGVIFYAVGAMLHVGGPSVSRFIDRYFNMLTVLLGVGLVAIVVIVKLL